MEYNPEILGKLVGMLMAYAVSSMGLLFAYINYRRRIVKAESVFTPLSGFLTVSIGGVLLAVLAFILWKLLSLPQAPEAEAAIGYVPSIPGTVLTEIGIPVTIIAASFLLTYWLYRHFAAQHSGGHAS